MTSERRQSAADWWGWSILVDVSCRCEAPEWRDEKPTDLFPGPPRVCLKCGGVPVRTIRLQEGSAAMRRIWWKMQHDRRPRRVEPHPNRLTRYQRRALRGDRLAANWVQAWFKRKREEMAALIGVRRQKAARAEVVRDG